MHSRVADPGYNKLGKSSPAERLTVMAYLNKKQKEQNMRTEDRASFARLRKESPTLGQL